MQVKFNKTMGKDGDAVGTVKIEGVELYSLLRLAAEGRPNSPYEVELKQEIIELRDKIGNACTFSLQGKTICTGIK